MRKEISIVIILLLSVAFVRAEPSTEIDIGLWSEGDITAKIDLNANGNINTYLNGNDYNDLATKDDIPSLGKNTNAIFRDIFDGIIGIQTGKVFSGPGSGPSDFSKRLGKLLVSTFYTRPEGNDLEIRLEACENALKRINNNQYEMAKNEVMFKHNITEFNFGDDYTTIDIKTISSEDYNETKN